VTFANQGKQVKPCRAIGIVAVDAAAPIASRGDVVQRAGKFKPEGSGHLPTLRTSRNAGMRFHRGERTEKDGGYMFVEKRRRQRSVRSQAAICVAMYLARLLIQNLTLAMLHRHKLDTCVGSTTSGGPPVRYHLIETPPACPNFFVSLRDLT